MVAGNWKMNGLAGPGLKQINGLIGRHQRAKPIACDIVICPPATLLGRLSTDQRRGGVAFGGQDCHVAEAGAHTGDISARMLKDSGCKYVIVGHSERRADHGEGSRLVRQKAQAAHAAGLTAIVCVGETGYERGQV